MTLTIRRTNNDELNRRKAELSEQLHSRYSKIEGTAMTAADLRDLAAMGLLSPPERKLYDELRRVEFLLGE